jgi:hypothetical protein
MHYAACNKEQATCNATLAAPAVRLQDLPAVRLQDFLPVLAAGNDGQRSQIGSVGAPYATLPGGIPRRVGYRAGWDTESGLSLRAE